MFIAIYFLFLFFSSAILSNQVEQFYNLSNNLNNISNIKIKKKTKKTKTEKILEETTSLPPELTKIISQFSIVLLASDENFSEYQVGCVKIRLQKANMLEFKADAIVNAANEGCLGGGGVDGQITNKGGKLLADARKKLPQIGKGVRCPTGQARLTIAGELPFRYILHAVAPVCNSDDDYNLLAQTYINTIKRAAAFNKDSNDKNFPEFALVNIEKFKSNYKITSISFPTLGTGIFGCDTQKGAVKIIPAVIQYFNTNCDTSIEQIIFTFYNPPDPEKANKDFAIYKQILDK